MLARTLQRAGVFACLFFGTLALLPDQHDLAAAFVAFLAHDMTLQGLRFLKIDL